MVQLFYKSVIQLVISLFTGFVSMQLYATQYTIDKAISRAQEQDPWISSSFKQQESLEAMSVRSGTLPDPIVNVSLANVPIDTFDFAQEPMTQFKVGVNQVFPRGQTLVLQQERFEKMSQIQPLARQDRHATVAVLVSQLWLDIHRYELIIQMIEEDRGLFENLVDFVQSNYSTASRKTQQQDLIRAQLELTQLEDRLTKVRQQRDLQLARMSEWLGDSYITLYSNREITELIQPLYLELLETPSQQDVLIQIINTHPKIRSIDQELSALDSNVQIAQQSYKPQWAVNASYGYREADPMGNERSDFFSIGIAVDLPLFTANRQDKQVQAAVADKGAVEQSKILTLRQLQSGFESSKSQYLRLMERKSLFDSRLLQEISEQREASLSAYTHDDGDFAEVIRASIAELNTRIEALNIDIDIQKNIAQLNYFLAGVRNSSNSSSTNEIHRGVNHE